MVCRFWIFGNSEFLGFVGLVWCVMVFVVVCSMCLVINWVLVIMMFSLMLGNVNMLLV